jgi:hypothetical protein
MVVAPGQALPVRECWFFEQIKCLLTKPKLSLGSLFLDLDFRFLGAGSIDTLHKLESPVPVHAVNWYPIFL